ncbi:MAG: tRNA preQ1(34) S-adenosylmethionine ribosyltransferase-isomerase QueA [Firmicutes bacterium]|nr:tRNA preQ1(34) S-adenosylmethionine ribosyltransferase-isomerase QueA [Bacillota bacterium]
MKTDIKDYWYDLPPELIAQTPLKKRDESKLLYFDGKNVNHGNKFLDLPKLLKKGDILVVNETKVLPIRLIGKKSTGAECEVFLLKDIGVAPQGDPNKKTYNALIRPAKRLKVGDAVDCGKMKVRISEKHEDGQATVELNYTGIFEEVLDEVGEVPLPSYIKNVGVAPQGDPLCERYNTIYACHAGSSAAPTAGLHFTPEVIKQVEAMGVEIVRIILHVGLGTFRPIKVDNILNHDMHSEEYFISPEAAEKINRAKRENRRVVGVGTTSMRALEHNSAQYGEIKAGSFLANSFIHNDYDFKIIDAMITNFHLPNSTLVLLVSAFVGFDNYKEIYKQAVEQQYRFFSFGDSSFLIRPRK